MQAVLGEKNEALIRSFLTSEQHAGVLIGSELQVFSDAIKAVASFQKQMICTALSPEEKSITIQQIRNLKQSLSLRHKKTHRLLIIERAETMTSEAQNSFLKLLEEPPEGLKMLLLCSAKNLLLTTIRSRSRIMHVAALSQNEAQNVYKKQGISSEEIQKTYAISRGKPGKLFQLLASDGTYTEAITTAKELLQKNTFERLTMLDALVKDKLYLLQVLQALDDVLRAVLHAEHTTAIKMQHIAKTRERIQKTMTSLQGNTNTKLVTLDVLLSL